MAAIIAPNVHVAHFNRESDRSPPMPGVTNGPASIRRRGLCQAVEDLIPQAEQDRRHIRLEDRGRGAVREADIQGKQAFVSLQGRRNGDDLGLSRSDAVPLVPDPAHRGLNGRQQSGPAGAAACLAPIAPAFLPRMKRSEQGFSPGRRRCRQIGATQ